ncbi:MAG: hypothetical protein ABFD24_07210 [Anaerolineaceae bacterium]|jgi:hypothetical protein
MYERHDEPLLPRRKFYKRLFSHVLTSLGILGVSLGIGILGYGLLEHLSFLDALLNASMILGGMGPVNALQTVGGKIFASFYALFAGEIFLIAAGVIITPVAHRLLHLMHIASGK